MEAKDTKMEDAPEAGKDMSKEIQEKSKAMVEAPGDPVKEDEEDKE